MLSNSINLLKLSCKMTPTPTRLFVLLGIFLIFPVAHADDFLEISLHNDSAQGELSVVTNWTLICEHLCSLNISGPACGPDCTSTEPVSESGGNTKLEHAEDIDFEKNHQTELCDTLCDNGLGGNRCVCPVGIIPAAAVKPPPSERNRICSDFCRFHHVTLRGCKRCPYDQNPKKPVKNSAPPPPFQPILFPSFASPFHPHRFDADEETPFATFDNSVDGSVQVTSAPPTTPDWNRLCATLCRQGTGGILCNCDLAPF